MPMIQIEQNSPKVIEDASAMITEMAAGLREEPGDTDNHYGRAMHATGFLAALRLYGLISNDVYDRLKNELNQASNAGLAEAGAAPKR